MCSSIWEETPEWNFADLLYAIDHSKIPPITKLADTEQLIVKQNKY
jgi:hypothetical protein